MAINKKTTAPIFSTIGIKEKARLEELAEREGYYKLSQFIRKILLDYLKKEG
jgi:hypothetical protein